MHSEATKEKIRQGVIARRQEDGTFTGHWIRRDQPCKACGTTFRPSTPRQTYCSWDCRPKRTPREKLTADVQSVSRRRKKMKAMAIELKGGCCERCGYNKCVDAMEFHHRDPGEKDFSIGEVGTRAWETIKAEIEKCELVCANCHREIHANDKSAASDARMT